MVSVILIPTFPRRCQALTFHLPHHNDVIILCWHLGVFGRVPPASYAPLSVTGAVELWEHRLPLDVGSIRVFCWERQPDGLAPRTYGKNLDKQDKCYFKIPTTHKRIDLSINA